MARITLSDLRHSYISNPVSDEDWALKQVDLNWEDGGAYALLGPSGCGKTTLLRMLAGFGDPTSGEIFLDGQPMAHVPPHKRQVNMVFQSYAIFPHLNVRQNIAFGLRKDRLSKQELNARVDEALELIRLQGFGDRRASEMSGGQRQRVVLARALILKPRLLICDEPVSALDVSIQAQVIQLLEELKTSFDLTIMFISHDLSLVRYFCDTIIVMYLGRIVESGSIEDVFANPRHPYTQALISSIPVPEPGHNTTKLLFCIFQIHFGQQFCLYRS